MVRINKLQRKFLEQIGIIKPRNKKWYFNGMTVANINSGSRAKSIYVEDSFISYIDPEWYRIISEKYYSKETIEGQIRHAKWYVEKYMRNKVNKENKS